MFSWGNKKYISTFWIKEVPYLLLWQSLISIFTTSTSIQIGHSLSHGLINACYINSKIYVGPNPIQQLSFTASTSVHIGHGLINACCINSKIYVEPNHNQQLSITASTSIQMDHGLIKACYINSNGCSSEGIHVFFYTEAHTFLFYHKKKDFTFNISHFLINGSAKSTENISYYISHQSFPNKRLCKKILRNLNLLNLNSAG